MAAAVLFGASSCVKEDISSSIAGGEVEVTITANLADLGTRAYGMAENVNVVYLGVYDQNGNLLGDLTNRVEGEVVSNGVATFTVVLLKDKVYDLVFWAQDKDVNCYQIDWTNRNVTVDYDGVVSQDDTRDAFFLVENEWQAGHDATTFVLNRPFAQLNAGLSEKDVENIIKNGVAVEALQSKVVVKNVATKLNLLTEADDVATDVEEFEEVTFEMAAKPAATEVLKVNNVDYTYLSMNYLLVDGKQNVDIEYTFFDGETNYVRPYYNVPVQRNYRTNILGNLISSPMDFTVIIDAAFNEPANEVAAWDGISVSEPAYDEQTQTYSVESGAELAWLAAAVNGTTRAGESFEGKTIKLTGDVELGGQEWTPIGTGAIFEGIFDGGNYTVSNFTVKQQEGHAGLFGNARATIKNLKVENVEIVAHHYAGAIVGQGYCRIDNCHVKNVNITLTTKNGDWGDKAGGIIGQNCEGTLSVKNSTATDVTIKGYRDLGGIAGMAHKNNIVSGCAANNISIEQDLTVNYEATTPVTLGGVVGRFGANVTYENNTEYKIFINGVERVNDGNGNYIGVGSIITVAGQKAVIFSIEGDVKAVSVEELNLNGKNWQNAMDWAAGLGQGWALASIYELDAIHAVRQNLNAALAADNAENALFCETEYVEEGKYALYLSSTIAEGNDPQGEAYFANRVMLKYFNLNGYWDYNYSTFATINMSAPLRSNYYARAVYTFPKVGSIIKCAGQKAIVYEVTADAYKAVSVEQGGEMTWDQAKDWAEGLGTGWSLASVEELQAIYDVRVELNQVLAADSADNALFEEDHKEEDGTYAAYWSSTLVESTSASSKAYYVYFDSQCRVTTSFTMFPVEYSRAVYTIAK